MKTMYAVLIALVLPLTGSATSWAGDCGCGVAAGCGCAAEAGYGHGSDAGCGCAVDGGCGCNSGDHHGGCPSGCGCCKVCKLVRVVRVVRTTCYGVKCTDIAVPGCGSKCTTVACIHCNGNGCSSCCGCESGACGQIRYPTGKPGCRAKVKTVKQLVKYETTKKICTYEWRVVNAGCCGCNSDCGAASNAGCGCANGDGCGCAAGHEGDRRAAEYYEGDAVPPPPTASPEA